jgi:anaerobic ribonucleoside-triphosphate reductase
MENVIDEKNTEKERVCVVRAEVYSRVVGYYRPVQAWNEGKREEFKERKYLNAEDISN